MYFRLIRFPAIILFVVIISFQFCDKPLEPEKSEPKLKLYINEFMALNRSTIADEKNQYDDWVEIYNGEDTSINLSYFYLTDNFNKKTKWRMPAVTIPPKKWILIWCDEDTSQGLLHANFKLDGGGERIGIFSLSLETIDTITYGPQKIDTSFGRFPDGYSNFKFMVPSPNNSNK